MRLTETYLKRLVREELSNYKQSKIQESAIVVTPQLLNKIIMEEYSKIKRQKLNEARRRRALR